MIVKDFEGRDWDVDFDAITVDEWRELKRKCKMTPRKFQEGMEEADPDALTFAYWLMLRQNGGTREPLGDNLKPDILELNEALGTATELEKEAQEAAKKAELEEAAAAAVPTGSRPAGDLSPEPVSQTAPSGPNASPPPAPVSGSGTATSSSSAPSTSSPSAVSAGSPPQMSGG